MIVGVCNIDLHIPQATSLKAKRQVLKSMLQRLRNKFNVSISEVRDNDLWQRASLGVASVANEKRFVNQILSQVVEQINRESQVTIIDYTIEIY